MTGFENLSGLKFVTLANQEIRIFQKIEFLNSFNPPFHLKDIGGQQKHVAHPTLTAAFPSCSIMIRSPIKVRLMSSGKRSFDRGMFTLIMINNTPLSIQLVGNVIAHPTNGDKQSRSG
ncbi:MAG: hypothetical protein DRQ49_01675 [Gammaproteobacteria bacterium]|nr:MAG: hypothetical protein DRQ49_01675 [Gammaproteobacteria bacterium]RKZ44688.1 MAG: hypothetical protein DRQ41_02155 [Gammaproteobacteria bacterium]RKZ76380.1 MAG: hypothetical protein DRQ57_04155 [Gammaproteobacteria bacterium]